MASKLHNDGRESLGFLLAADASNVAEWKYSVEESIVLAGPLAGKTFNQNEHPDFDTDPDYTFNRALIAGGALDNDDVFKQQINVHARNRTDYGKQRHIACKIVVGRLEEEVKFIMETKQAFRDARMNFDFLLLIKLAIDGVVGSRGSKLYLDAHNGMLQNRMNPGDSLSDYSKRAISHFRRWELCRGDAAADSTTLESLARSFIENLGPQYEAFKYEELAKLGRNNAAARMTLQTAVQAVREWAGAVGIETTQKRPIAPPPFTAMTALTGPCWVCGKDHHKQQCTVTNPTCAICKREGKSVRTYNTHTTEGHTGPKKPQGKRKSYKEALTGKPQQALTAHTPQVSFESDSDEESDDSHIIMCAMQQPHIVAHEIREDPIESISNAPKSLSNLAYAVRSVSGDGHCMFQSIAVAAGTRDYAFYRATAANYLRMNENGTHSNGMLIRDAVMVNNQGQTFEEVMHGIETTAYGGEIEMWAIESATETSISVYVRKEHSFRRIREGCQTPRALQLKVVFKQGLREAGNHYDALIPREMSPTADELPQPLEHLEQLPESPPQPLVELHELREPANPIQVFTTTTHPKKKAGKRKSKKNRERKASMDKEETVSSVMQNEKRTAPEGVGTFILDSGATTHLLNSGVPLVATAATSATIHGIGGDITATRTGVHRTFGTTLIHPNETTRNIISLSRLSKSHDLRYHPESNCFTATKGDETLTFGLRNGLYSLNDPKFVLVANQAVPPDKLDRYQTAISLHNNLNHPSDDVLARSLERKIVAFKGCTARDLREARQHFGPCTACLAGKTTQDPAPTSTSPPAPLGSTLHVDIAFISAGGQRKSPFLVAVEETTGMAAVRPLKDRTKDVLVANLHQTALDFNLLSRQTVRTIRVDSETGFQATRDELSSHRIKLVVVPPERHVRLAERVIRELKNYMRAARSSLPYSLPRSLYALLFMDVACTRNVVSHLRRDQSPREALTGTKPNIERDFKFAFGSIGHTRVTGLATKDDMHPRSELAVIVGHYVQEAGAVMVWLPRSKRVCKRNSFKPITATAKIIDLLNSHRDDEPKFSTEDDPHSLPPDDDDQDSDSSLEPQQGYNSGAPTQMGQTSGIESSDSESSEESDTDAAPMTLRRSSRQRRPNPKYAQAEEIDVVTTGPRADGNFTIRQAQAIDHEKATKAIQAEIRQMLDLNVIGRKRREQHDRPLPSKMFLKWKTIAGELAFKARLVIGGHLQDKESMGETYSPTVNPESTNVALTIAAHFRRKPYTIDVSGAFLHVPLQGATVHMRLSKDVSAALLEMDNSFKPDVRDDGTLIVRIRKAIYGLGESSRQWHEHLATTLQDLGYQQLAYDRCVFMKPGPNDTPQSLICVHVDDLLVVDLHGNNKDLLTGGLIAKYGKVTLNDDKNLLYLGVHIESVPGGFRLHQRSLIEAIDYPIADRSPRNPASPDLLKIDPTTSEPARDIDKFRSTLMRILYITSKTRFDLMFIVSVLAGRQHQCTVGDEEALTRLVGFLKETSDWCLEFRPQNLVLATSADASYACHPDARGHSGFACDLGGATILAKSTKQKLVAKSSAESELLALNSATEETIYLRNLLKEMGFPQQQPTVIKQDNNSAIIMAKKGELGTKRTKHFNVRHYFVSDHIGKDIVLEHQPGISILADGLTKPLIGPEARMWAKRLLGIHEIANRFPSSKDQTVRGGVLHNETLPRVSPQMAIPVSTGKNVALFTMCMHHSDVQPCSTSIGSTKVGKERMHCVIQGHQL